ncbi:MAG: hypothetical protein AAGF33_09205 [Pseudomonadota bacterium]
MSDSKLITYGEKRGNFEWNVARKKSRAGVRHGRSPVGAPPTYENVWMLSGLGSRGFTFAPWLADGLAAHLHGEPSLFSGPAQKAISPLRFLFSSLKRD